MDYKSIFIDPTARLTGRVDLAEENYIGPYVRVQASAGFIVQLSAQDNLQDHVSVLATCQNVLIGERTSIAHGAKVSNTVVGNFVFVGFNARVENAVLEDGVMVQHGAQVIGVTIPQERIVPPGMVITRQEQVFTLPSVGEGHQVFKEEVVEVNNEFANGYAQMSADIGENNLRGMCPSPRTTWNTGFSVPFLEKDVRLASGVRLIGDVRLGGRSVVGAKTSIRGDEGAPITIGDEAQIGSRVTFHALKEQTIFIGTQLSAGERCVLHGALSIGDQVSIGERAVVFKSTLGSRIRIGQGAIVVGVNLADGVCVPDGALILDQNAADRLAC